MLNNKHRLAIQILIIVIAIASLLYSCSQRQNTGDLKNYIEHLKQASNKPLTSTPVSSLKMPTPEAYKSDALRSPFGTFGETNPNSINTKSLSTNPLLAYSLSMLKLVGTLSQNGTTTAFILAPDTIIYQVQVGEKIGDHQGSVTEIHEDRIEVMEQESGSVVGAGQRLVTLRLKEEH